MIITMVLTSAAPTFFMTRFLSTFPLTNKTITCGGTNNSSHISQTKLSTTPAAKVQAKDNVINTGPPGAAAKEIPDHLNLESGTFDGVCDMLRGRLDKRGVFQQNFSIRSYELGPDGKATIGCLMKRLQETSIEHCRCVGLFAGGFGSTPEMSKRGLVWVFRKLQIVVENYPSWAAVIQVDTWTGAYGNNGLFRDWIFRDYRTGDILIRATGLYVMMNMNTRKLSTVIPEIRDEIKPVLVDCDPLVDITNTKLRRIDIDARNYAKNGLAPSWSDLDVNQHVRNAKYVDWVFESIPISILESQELSSITLEFRRECKRDTVLQSLTAMASGGIGDSTLNKGAEFDHLLRFETGSEILRARTMWRPKF